MTPAVLSIYSHVSRTYGNKCIRACLRRSDYGLDMISLHVTVQDYKVNDSPRIWNAMQIAWPTCSQTDMARSDLSELSKTAQAHKAETTSLQQVSSQTGAHPTPSLAPRSICGGLAVVFGTHLRSIGCGAQLLSAYQTLLLLASRAHLPSHTCHPERLWGCSQVQMIRLEPAPIAAAAAVCRCLLLMVPSLTMMMMPLPAAMYLLLSE